MSKTFRTAWIFPLILLAACQTAPPAREHTAPQAAPAISALPKQGARFLVDPAASEVRLLVYRTGPLARFGHNHVVIGRPRGAIVAGASAAASGFRLELAVASLSVDDPAARAEEGGDFSSDVSDEARRGTREHMLGKDALDAAASPEIEIDSISLSGPRWNPEVTARVTLRGAARELRFPAAVVQNGDRLTVIAGFALNQSDFGIVPYSVLGGGLRVQDRIDVRVRLVARRD
jgi:polyisoprenoid-binding protein YceI